MKLVLSFDYDSPAGYRQSFNNTVRDPWADFRGTEALLKVLAAHDVKTSFAVVGSAALEGVPPEQCREQIREIHATGHEIASHSMYHRFIPPMTSQELFEDLKASKSVLESCIGTEVRGFIPPFNRPCHFPEMNAFSLSDVLGLQGRGRGQQSVGSLVKTLGALGFGWCRASFQRTIDKVRERLGISNHRLPAQPFLFENVVVVPLHATGFGPAATRLVRRYIDRDIVLTTFAHPNKAIGGLDSSGENDERAEVLDSFLSAFAPEREQGKLKFYTMTEIEAMTRGNGCVKQPSRTSTIVL